MCWFLPYNNANQSYLYIYIPSFWSLLPLPPHPNPLCHHGEPGWDPCVTQKLPTIYFTRDSVYMSILLSQFVPLSPFPTVSTSSFSTKFIGIIFLDSIYMC